MESNDLVATRTAPCALCGAPTTLKFTAALVDGLVGRYFECARCHFLRSDHLDRPEILSLVYRRATPDDDPGAAWRQHCVTSRLSQLAKARVFPRGPAFRVLDFGSASGFVASYASARLGWTVRGFDAYATPCYAPSLTLRSWEEVVSNAPYDLVIATEIFEHLPDPVPTLRRLGSVLGSGSAFVYATTTPYTSLACDSSWDYLAPHTGQHCSFYSRAALQHVAAALGTSTVLEPGGASEWLFVREAGKGSAHLLIRAATWALHKAVTKGLVESFD